MNMTNLRLLLAARGRRARPLAARFGAIRSLHPVPDPDQLVDEGLARPAYLATWRGDYNYRARNYVRAREHYERALALDPTWGPAHYGLAETLFWLEDWPGAETAYSAATVQYDRKALAYKGLGWSLYNQGKLAEAERAWRRALGEFEAFWQPSDIPHIEDVLRALGRQMANAGNCDAARALVERAPRFFPALQFSKVDIQPCG